jgi:hypothetical protein
VADQIWAKNYTSKFRKSKIYKGKIGGRLSLELELSDEYVEAAGPIFKAGELFDKEIVATEHNTDIGEESQLVLRSKAEEIGAADHKDAKGLVTLIIFPVSLTVLHLT